MNHSSIPRTPELLAPAGSYDALVVAIAAGADAVYLGGRDFGARHYASNFTDDAIVKAVSYAHLRGVKVYVTVNVLISERELVRAMEYLLFLYQSGVDAVLVQDFGLLSCIRECIPKLTVHASTQMTVHTREGAHFVASLGCSRLVLSRELTSDEIIDIAGAIGDDSGIEVFIHGALCYAYSGQCLLSSVIGGRSGNRGMCAQPCRKPYILFSGENTQTISLKHLKQLSLPSRYLLSTKDLCLYPVLERICRLPVESLKIEGRMRSPEYVGIVVSIYRNALDQISLGSFTPVPRDTESLILAFSRGFTTGYISGSSFRDVMGREKPGKQGICIGTVEKANSNGTLVVRRRSETIPEIGDGMVCTGKGKDNGFILFSEPEVRGERILIKSGISCNPGDDVYLTSRADDSRKLRDLLKDPDRRYLGSIPLDCSVGINPDGTVSVSCKVREDGISVSYMSAHRFGQARTRPVTKDQIRTNLLKTGGTLFSFHSLEIVYDESGFAPVRVINEIRRELLERMEREITNRYLPDRQDIGHARRMIQNLVPSPVSLGSSVPSVAVIVSDIDSASTALASGGVMVWIEWSPGPDINRYTRDITDLAGQNTGLGIKIPRIIRRNDLDRFYRMIPSLYDGGIQNWMVDSAGIAERIGEMYPDSTFSGYYGLNITNHASVNVFSHFSLVTLSPELSGDQIRDLAESLPPRSPRLGVMVQGLLDAMVSEDQLSSLYSDRRVLAIRDEKNVTFPVITDYSKRTHILNGMETSLLEYLPRLSEAGISRVIIDARWRSEEYVRNITGIYRDACELLKDGWSSQRAEELKEKLRGFVYGGITSGTYKRGLV